MAEDKKSETYDTGIISLETLLDDKSIYVHLYNLYYCSELDFNLLSLGILEKKGFEFIGKQKFFYVIDNKRDTMLEAKKNDMVCFLV